MVFGLAQQLIEIIIMKKVIVGKKKKMHNVELY
jgi:hypothetical protein